MDLSVQVETISGEQRQRQMLKRVDTPPQKIQLGVQRILGIMTLQRWRSSGLSYRQHLRSGQRAQLAFGEAPSFILGKTLWLEVRIKGCVCSYATLTLQGWSESLRVTGVHVSSRLCGSRCRLSCTSQHKPSGSAQLPGMGIRLQVLRQSDWSLKPLTGDHGFCG